MIYIASAYTQGAQALNVRFQLDVFNTLLEQGYVPFAPLQSHLQQMFRPIDYDLWMGYDLAIVERCDALVRLEATHEPSGYVQAESEGADREWSHARGLGLPAFTTLEKLWSWSETMNAMEVAG